MARKADLFEYNGKQYSVQDLCRITGKSKSTIYKYLTSVRSIDELIKKCSLTRKQKTFNYKDKLYTLRELKQFSKVCYNTYVRRIYLGWSIEDALTIPKVTGYKQGGHNGKCN